MLFNSILLFLLGCLSHEVASARRNRNYTNIKAANGRGAAVTRLLGAKVHVGEED